MGSRPQESPSGLTQLSSAPTRWPSGLRSALSGRELSRGSAQDSRPSPRQASSLTASPVRRSKLPPKALLSKASLHPGRALPGPQTGIPKPSPQVPCPRLSGSLNAGPTSGPGRPEVWGSHPRFYSPGPAPAHPRGPRAPRSAGRSGPGARGCSPWKSGRKSHSQKAPKLHRSEVRSQAAAAAETSPSSPRSEPHGQQPHLTVAIRVRPELGLRPPTSSPENYNSQNASLRGSHRLWPTTPGSLLSPLKGLPGRPAAGPEGGLQGEPANRPIQDCGLSFHGHGN